MSDGIKRLPREVNIGFVRDHRTGGYHNVLEVCAKTEGARYVMAQDSETTKERDKYKLRAHLQAERIDDLEHKIQRILGTQECENISSESEALAKIYLICRE